MKFIDEKVVKTEIKKNMFHFENLRIGNKEYTLSLVNGPVFL